jgi:hypothetical protein
MSRITKVETELRIRERCVAVFIYHGTGEVFEHRVPYSELPEGIDLTSWYAYALCTKKAKEAFRKEKP